MRHRGQRRFESHCQRCIKGDPVLFAASFLRTVAPHSFEQQDGKFSLSDSALPLEIGFSPVPLGVTLGHRGFRWTLPGT